MLLWNYWKNIKKLLKQGSNFFFIGKFFPMSILHWILDKNASCLTVGISAQASEFELVKKFIQLLSRSKLNFRIWFFSTTRIQTNHFENRQRKYSKYWFNCAGLNKKNIFWYYLFNTKCIRVIAVRFPYMSLKYLNMINN